MQHVRHQLTGAAPPGIPTNYLQQPEDGRPYWSGTGVPVIGVAQFPPGPSGLLIPVTAASGPAPMDAIAVFNHATIHHERQQARGCVATFEQTRRYATSCNSPAAP
jgi:hypothetical protein